jgi:hypothetical protein
MKMPLKIRNANRLSVPGAKSLAISTDAIDPRVQRASPTTNWVVLLRSVLRQLVMSKETSCCSSKSSMAAR